MTDKSDDKNSNWREKYFDALEQQEQQEKIFHSQQELLRRALVRVSVSADGQNDELDTILGQLRERIRSTKGNDIGSLLSRLDEVVLNFEQQRDSNAQKIRQSLVDTVKPLQQLELSRTVKKEISQYLSQVPQYSKKVHLYPSLLQQLASIQQQALKEIERPHVGFWQKLLGGQSDEIKSEDNQGGVVRGVVTDKIHKGEKVVVSDQPSSAPIPANVIRDYAAIDAELVAASGDGEAGGRQNFRHTKIEMAPEFIDKVTVILNKFLNGLENETTIAEKAQAIRKHINDSISADNFLLMLENVRDLVMQAYLSTNHDFASYLKNVHQELADIYSIVGGAAEAESLLQVASHNMKNSMIMGMQAIEDSAETATDLEQLKRQLNSQIGNIRNAFDSYQQTEQAQQQLATQLETLCNKIKTMEMEAEKNRSVLEKQRHKALHDPLTHLPNREYYNERSAYEFQRWQRYSRPLTIAIFDIDHFKKVNDGYGHQAGDKVLKVIGNAIATRLREVDFFCRFGGEEFVAILPETALEDAMIAINKIRIDIANASFNYKDQPLSITISIGATVLKQGDDWEAAFARADKALYAAKADGRNCAHSL